MVESACVETLVPQSREYLVRVGVIGAVGRFRAIDWTLYERGRRVICRTPRGLEVGEILNAADAARGADRGAPREPARDGEVLRHVTVEDDLLIARLERHRHEAYGECVKRLRAVGIDAALLDVEHLFDGRAIYFYFLGEQSPEIEQLTGELAEIYETKIQFRKFAQTLDEGCGPLCGTEEGGGCADGGCVDCVVAVSCKESG